MVGSEVTGEDGMLDKNLVCDIIEISVGTWDEGFNIMGIEVLAVVIVDKFIAADNRRVKVLVFLTILRPGTGGAI